MLERLEAGRGIAYQQAGRGLLLVAYRTRRRTLYGGFTDAPSYKTPHFDGLAERVQALALPGSRFNAMLLTSLVYSRDFEPSLMPGVPPIFWWPLGVDNLHDLVFAKTVLLSIYNPAHLFAQLEAQGFSITVAESVEAFCVEKAVGDHQLRMEKCGYLMFLVRRAVLSEDQVVELVVRTIDEALVHARGVEGPVRCDPQYVLRFLG